ncbi:MAG TPA: hypothetical protein VF189_02860 [Patescibacteria group bacterium]
MFEKYKPNPLCLAPYDIPSTTSSSENIIIEEVVSCPFRENGKEEALCSEMRRTMADSYKKVCPVLKRHPNLINIISKNTPER